MGVERGKEIITSIQNTLRPRPCTCSCVYVVTLPGLTLFFHLTLTFFLSLSFSLFFFSLFFLSLV